MKKYITIALCSSYFLFVPIQANALVCSPLQSDKDYFNCIAKCVHDIWWTPAWMCA